MPLPSDPLYQPNVRVEEEKSGLVCFLDQTRVCGADCMAYVTPLDGPDYKDQQWAKCLLLTNAHRGGKHLTILAAQGEALLKNVRNEAADRARANQPPPPKGG